MPILLKIIMRGNQAYQRRMRTATRRFRSDLRKRMRQSANLVRKEARRNIRAQFKKKPSVLARRISVSVRFKRGNMRATIFPKGVQGVIGDIHERGLTFQRKSRSGKIHSATYQKNPWLAPAVARTRAEVFRKLGLSFRVV